MNLNDPYTVTYTGIYAVCDRKNRYADIIERSSCYGGSAWTMHHYASSPLIEDVRSVGNMIRYRTRTGRVPLKLEASVAAAGIESVEVTIPDVDVKKAKIIALKTELAKELSETEQHKSRIAKIEAELKKLEG